MKTVTFIIIAFAVGFGVSYLYLQSKINKSNYKISQLELYSEMRKKQVDSLKFEIKNCKINYDAVAEAYFDYKNY